MEPSASDSELLADWVRHRREPAFHALVGRYAKLVHMTARRTSGDDSIAADASQLVFILLARKAASLVSHPSLAGWLHVTTVLKTRDLMDKARREHRKRQHLLAAMETQPHSSSSDAWKELQPVIDDALASLPRKDREALLLRYYRSLSVGEIAATLGIATEAARKRIDRATGRLRDKLVRRGCQAGIPLSVVLAAGFSGEAPAATLSVSFLTSQAIAATGSAATPLTSLLIVMKSSTWIPPVVAVALIAGWFVPQRRAMAAMEKRSLALLERLDDQRSAAADGPRSPFPAPGDAGRNRKIDWEALAMELEETRMESGVADSRTMVRLQTMLLDMSPESIAAALRETVELPDSASQLLKSTLLNTLIEKNPGYAVRAFGDRISENSPLLNRPLPRAMGDWVKKDPQAAIAWLDRQIADGKFDSASLDGKSRMRWEFEGWTIRSLISSDRETAATRLEGIPAEQRGDFLRSCLAGAIQTEDQAAFAAMVRIQVPERDRMKTLITPAANLASEEGYETVAGFMDRIQASPAERAACVANAVESRIGMLSQNGAITREQLAVMREWTLAQAPETAGNVTGRALGIATSGPHPMEFSKAADLALEYQAGGDGDSVLAAFLSNGAADRNRESARNLAMRISDPGLRERLLKRFE